MEADKSLILKSERIQELVDTLLEPPVECPKDMLNASPHPNNLTMAMFAELVYTPMKSGESDAEYGERILSGSVHLDGWRLLITATNTAMLNGYFGAAFVHTGSQQVAVAHRGTVITNIGALYTDVKGIFGTKYTSCMNSAMTFVDQIREIIYLANEKHGHYSLAITGHSLGAWLAQITTFSVKYLSISNNLLQNKSDRGIHAKTVGFDSPGARDMLEKVLDDYFNRYAMNIFLDMLDITLYISAPNRINTCGVHLGRIYHIFIDVSKFSYIKYNILTHAVSNFVANFKDKNSRIGEVFDWAKNSKEYKEVFEKHADDSEFLLERVRRHNVVELKSIENAEFRVFSEDELQMLYKLHQLQEQKSTQNILLEFVKNKLNVDITYLFPNFDLDHNGQMIVCKSGESLSELCNRLKQLMRWLKPDFTRAVDKQITVFRYAAEFICYAEGQSYLNSLPKCCLDFKDPVDIRGFLDSSTERVLSIVTSSRDGAFQMTRLQNILHQIQRSGDSSDNVIKYFSESNYTFMESPQMQSLYSIYSWPIGKEYMMVVDNTSSSITLEDRTKLINHVHSKSMKLILITSQPVHTTNTFELIKTVNSILLMDLTRDSQNKIFERDNIIFRGDEGFSFRQFFGDDCSLEEIDQILGSESLKNLVSIKNYAINLKDTRPNFGDLQVPFFKLNVKISKALLLSCIESLKANILVVISGLSREELETGTDWKQLNRKEIIIAEGDVDLFFKDTCNKNQNKCIYLLEVSGGEISCKLIFDKDFNLPRTFLHRAYIDVQKFAEIKHANDLFVICCDQDKTSLLELIENCKERNTFAENIQIATTQEAEIEIIQNKSSKNIHFVKSDGKNQLLFEWRYSHGSVESLRCYVTMSSCDELTLSKTEHNFVLIIDEPGTGKTTSLACLSRIIKSAWIIYIEIKDFQKNIDRLPNGRLTDKNAAKFILNEYSADADDSLAHRTLVHLLQSKTRSKQVVLMFNGLDELDDDKENATEKVVRLLIFLKSKPSVQIFLTARKYLKESLETKLNVFSTCFGELNSGDQLEFLVKIWQSCLSLQLGGSREEWKGRLRVYSEELLRQAKQMLRTDIDCFMGVPLHLRMLAEVFRPQINPTAEPPQLLQKQFDIISVPALYKMFITLKYDIYIHDKTFIGEFGDKILEKDIFNYTAEMHGELGFQTFFSNFYQKNIVISQTVSEVERNKLSNTINRYGLVQSKENGEFEFVHPTYAEYFCAQIIVRWANQSTFKFHYQLVKDILLPKILLHPDSKVIRLFLNFELGEMKMSDKMLQLYAGLIKQLWSETNAIFRNEEHQTALHIAVKERNVHIVELLINGLHYERTQEAFVNLITQNDSNNDTVLHIMDQPTFHGTTEDDALCNRIMENILNFIVPCSFETKEKIFFAYLFNRDVSKCYVSNYLLKSDNTLTVFNKVVIRVKEVEKEIIRFKEAFRDNVELVKEILSGPLLLNNIERYCFVSMKHKDQGKTALHLAAQYGHCSVLELIMQQTSVLFTALMAQRDFTKKTPLHTAVEFTHLDVVKFFVEQGADINTRCKLGKTALMYAACRHNCSLSDCPHELIVKYLVESGAKIDSTGNDGRTVLHIAISNNNLSVVKYLVESHAEINFKDNDGLTALHISACYNNLFVVKCLIESGAEINSVSNDGRTALHNAAAGRDNLSVVQYLIEKSAEITFKDNVGNTPLHIAAGKDNLSIMKYLIESGAQINSVGNKGKTALHYAAAGKDNLSVVEYLIEKRAEITSKDNDGNTPLHIAARNNNLSIVKFLIYSGAEINSICNDGKSALHNAATGKDNLSVVKYLIESGASINSKDKFGMTALHNNMASSSNIDLSIVKYLIGKGAEINSVDNDGRTALHLAVSNGSLSMLIYLKDKNAEINSKDNDGRTALHIAVSKNILSVVKYLIESHAEINSKDNDGRTALHIAVSKNNLPIVRYLIESGAEINSTDNDGRTALHLAESNKNSWILKYLTDSALRSTL